MVIVQASDFFADESAVRDVSKKVGRMVFEMQEAASRLSTKQRASVSTMLSPHADNKADTSLTNVQQSPAEMVRRLSSVVCMLHETLHRMAVDVRDV